MPERLAPRLRRRVTQARAARLATVRPRGGPHVVVITFALEGDRLVTAVDHKPKATADLQRLTNIRANPEVSVLVDHYEDDWSQLWWVRADGGARIVRGGPERDGAVALLADKYPQYRDRPPQGPVIVVEVARWRSWTA